MNIFVAEFSFTTVALVSMFDFPSDYKFYDIIYAARYIVHVTLERPIVLDM